VQVEDVATDPELSAAAHALSRAGNVHTVLAVPLLLKGHPIGAITLTRTRVAPFDDKQVALVESFADQAVIAIENSRLFEAEQASKRELTEALEQQTATADVLKVISRSALDVQKVLDALVESAARLTDANDGAIYQVFGDGLRLVAHYGQIPTIGPIGQHTVPLVRERFLGRVVLDRRTIHMADALAADEYPESRKIALQLGYRTLLAVPLVHAGKAIGVILMRGGEVRPFTERQIELVNTFADQAVIAIENTRLFEEVQAQTLNLSIALQRQTATSEILGIISASPGQLEPVFNAILERARELCAAKFGHLLLLDGQAWRAAALHNLPPALMEFWRSAPPVVALRGTLLSRLRETKQPYQVEDLRLSEPYRMRAPLTIATVELAGARTLLGVPLLKDGQVVGAIVLYRTEVRPFDERQIALLSSFADQAIIAIDNTRLFEEVRART